MPVYREKKREKKILFEGTRYTRERTDVPLISAWTTKTRLLGLLQPIPLERSPVNTRTSVHHFTRDFTNVVSYRMTVQRRNENERTKKLNRKKEEINRR